MFSFSDWFSICTKCTKVPKRKSQVTITSTSSSVTKQANRKSPVNNPQHLKRTCTEIKQDTEIPMGCLTCSHCINVFTVAHILSCLEFRRTTARCETSRLRVIRTGVLKGARGRDSVGYVSYWAWVGQGGADIGISMAENF